MKKVFFSVAAILALSLSAFAGTPDSKDSRTSNQVSSTGVFHYVGNSTSPGAFANPANWAEGPAPSNNCGTTGDKPCEITAEDQTELQAMLSGRSNTSVLTIADSRRN
ncbi:MAG: hypothetical protein BGO31_12915 [Bacteroidetes bacterium 43-16]|nr:MAG: hypothetical protein BGO31_12915 [Bacteroidetes bacterium 43-16]